MRAILSQRPLRFVFAANMISMFGSGMNSAAVGWHILQVTHNEMALGMLIVLQTVPAALSSSWSPFSRYSIAPRSGSST
jgi:hypothetical protein